MSKPKKVYIKHEGEDYIIAVLGKTDYVITEYASIKLIRKLIKIINK